MVIPDIQVGNTDAVLDLSLIGIPHGAGVVSAQVQMARGKKDRIRRNARLLKEAEDRLGFKNIIIYGHTDAQDVAERADFSANVIFVTARTARRREYLNSGSTINSQKVKGIKKKKVVRR
jgi:flagellar motor protein MotB